MDETVSQIKKVIDLMKYFTLIEFLVINVFIFCIYDILSLSVLAGLSSVLVIILWFKMFNSILKGNKLIFNLVCFIYALLILFSLAAACIYVTKIPLLIFFALLITIYFLHLFYFFSSKNVNAVIVHKTKQDSIHWLYSWLGKSIGYKEDEYLWSGFGEIIGKFNDSEIYSVKGHYLGELYSNGRLVFDKTKAHKTITPYEGTEIKEEFKKPANTPPLVLYPNFLDFLLNDEEYYIT